MKSTHYIIILIVIIVILSVMSKPIKSKLARGLRNNNPGNIRLTAEKWQGEIEGKDKDFKVFKSISYGYRAMFVLLRTYAARGLNTPRKIIEVYAPSNENHTDAYINTVCKRTGFAEDHILTKPADLRKFVEAISYVENGVPGDETKIRVGYNLI